ncbi:MAG: response regulator [Planctomycetia bacterium]|uniref:Two-component system response regulator n=1 Tax=Candidatus Brocadia sapporoensis TaxID=392547 RepID=A0A1V6LYC5_9BACT|nr:response regulator [Candidatus Brocadia sapporoensis]MCC7239428.1 response regulator [Candidatus Brocadia sp.]QOJ05830.1 MAG: response regulator [Planctomycetia bacterium]TVL96057.1 MAG: response regulator [Candidatus Brocadia sp. BL1]MDG6004802.1 response regulator [Candidatus Brocadia sp.]OQD45130.1 two-component system response regulator [Candidatus Brocadia sapporoensis]
MKNTRKPFTILIAEDDPDDRLILKDAFEEAGVHHVIHYVEDGQELMDYLHARRKHSRPNNAPHPAIILLDLNMPRKNGQDALREIKSDPDLKRIPVIIMTTSKRVEDISLVYDLGANSYVLKPTDFTTLVMIVKGLSRYWFEIVELPH